MKRSRLETVWTRGTSRAEITDKSEAIKVDIEINLKENTGRGKLRRSEWLAVIISYTMIAGASGGRKMVHSGNFVRGWITLNSLKSDEEKNNTKNSEITRL